MAYNLIRASNLSQLSKLQREGVAPKAVTLQQWRYAFEAARADDLANVEGVIEVKYKYNDSDYERLAYGVLRENVLSRLGHVPRKSIVP